MNWFRFHHESLFCPKIQTLPGDVYKAWVNLLCLASMQKNRGYLPPVPDIAYHLRLDVPAAEALIADLISRNLLDGTPEGLRPHDWESWQFDRSPGAERQKRYRDRHRNVTPDVTGRGHGDVMANGSDVTNNVTRYETVTSSITGDSDTDSDPPHIVPPPGERTPAEGSPLPGKTKPARPAKSAPSPDNPLSSDDPFTLAICLEAMAAVRESLGNDAAKRVGRDRKSIEAKIGGHWECLTAAARKVGADLVGPRGSSIASPVGLMLTIAKDYALNGIPEPPRPRIRTFHDGSPALPTNVLRAPSRDRANDQHPTEALG